MVAPLTQVRLEEIRQVYLDCDRNVTRAATILGLARSTVQHHLAKMDLPPPDRDTVATKGGLMTMPSFVLNGDEDEPIESILDAKERMFNRKVRNASARDWFKIRVNETKPYGILAFGDAHLDDDGANVPLLRKHLEIAAQPGVYSISIGDVSNNWIGRLERLYANQETSRKTGKRLVEWFMWDSGASWLCFLAGNHDVWNDGFDFLTRLAQKKIPVIDWKAQFSVEHPSGTSCKIDASHGRKGNSMWNTLHATLKAAKLGEMADAYLTGHTHNYGCEDLEIAERRHSAWLVQLRGYKFFDSYALYNNFAEHQRGSAVLLIVDPSPDAPRRIIQCFEDVERGYQFLEMLRA